MFNYQLAKFCIQLIFQILHEFRHDLIDHLIVQCLRFILQQETDSIRFFAEIEKIAYETEKKLLKEVSLFDVYEGKNLEAGKKSYAVSFLSINKARSRFTAGNLEISV